MSNKNRNFARNASACLLKALIRVCNILATKLAYWEEMTLCYKFRPSDDLFSGFIKSSKKARYLICYRRDPTKPV